MHTACRYSSGMANDPTVYQSLLDQTDPPFAADAVFIDHAQHLTFEGRDRARAIWHAYFSAGFADTRLRMHRRAEEQGTCAFAFELQGRHERTFQGLPPTGLEILVPMSLFCSLAAGEVRQIDLYYDAGTLLGQLGFGPRLETDRE